jgi:DNA-binding transcriptional LysR family regulator
MTTDQDWEGRIGRRLRLRDLHIVFTVAEHGSMAKAAGKLGVTQSAVSQMIADVEQELGVRLFDRSRRGVEATAYGLALIRRGKAAFDELRHGIQEIDYLKNEGIGEIRIGCPETLAASVLPTAIDVFSGRWPGVIFEVETFTGADAAAKLRDRSIDLVFARGGPSLDALAASEDFKITTLFEDRLSVVVGQNSRWAKLRRVDLADLADAPWIVLPHGWGEEVIPEAFRLRGLPPPHIALKTFSIHLRLHLLLTGRYVSALPASVLRLHQDRFDLKELRIELPEIPYAVAIVTLKNRTLSPVVDHFIRSTAAQFEKHRGATSSAPRSRNGVTPGGQTLISETVDVKP